MKCRYCNIALAPLRSLTDGEFCCDDHRHAYHEEEAAGKELCWQPPPLAAQLPLPANLRNSVARAVTASFIRVEPRDFHPAVVKPAATGLRWQASNAEWTPAFCDRLLPLQFSATPENSAYGPKSDLPANLQFPSRAGLPQLGLDPITIPIAFEPEPELQTLGESADTLGIEAEAESEAVEETGRLARYRRAAHSWHWLQDAWRNAPNDLKIVTILLPILLALGLGPALKKFKPGTAPAPVAKKMPSVGTGSLQQVVANRWANLHQSILNRAAVEFTDDFRSGLDAWDSRSNLTASWSYDATGFVQPGPLAVFKPTEDMTDYRFQFLGEIDQKALGCAFRAADLNNYYAVKFTVVKPGPLPLVRMVRYAVINGKEGRHVEKPLPITARPDTLYRIMVDVRGNDFTIMAQGQVVDFWSDSSIPRGGVGFFCGRGEKARVRWVEVSHQYDALGRLCAYLAPYGFEGKSGNWN